MRAARVGEESRERDLLVRTLLQEQPALSVKEKHTERSVKHALLDIAHKMAWKHHHHHLQHNKANLLPYSSSWSRVQ